MDPKDYIDLTDDYPMDDESPTTTQPIVVDLEDDDQVQIIDPVTSHSQAGSANSTSTTNSATSPSKLIRSIRRVNGSYVCTYKENVTSSPNPSTKASNFGSSNNYSSTNGAFGNGPQMNNHTSTSGALGPQYVALDNYSTKSNVSAMYGLTNPSNGAIPKILGYQPSANNYQSLASVNPVPSKYYTSTATSTSGASGYQNYNSSNSATSTSNATSTNGAGGYQNYSSWNPTTVTSNATSTSGATTNFQDWMDYADDYDDMGFPTIPSSTTTSTASNKVDSTTGNLGTFGNSVQQQNQLVNNFPTSQFSNNFNPVSSSMMSSSNLGTQRQLGKNSATSASMAAIKAKLAKATTKTSPKSPAAATATATTTAKIIVKPSMATATTSAKIIVKPSMALAKAKAKVTSAVSIPGFPLNATLGQNPLNPFQGGFNNLIQQLQPNATGKSVAATKKNNDYLKGVTSKMKSAMENILLYIQQDETSLAVPSFDKDSTGQDASATDGYFPSNVLAAFGHFLDLPGYSEVLVKDPGRAKNLLRLALGFKDDGDGTNILSSPIAASLPTLPFVVFKELLEETPPTSTFGISLRNASIKLGAMQELLNCLAIFTHQTSSTENPSEQSSPPDQEKNETPKPKAKNWRKNSNGPTRSWAKGTGYSSGYGSRQSWDINQSLMRQSIEEDLVTAILNVLASYIGTEVLPKKKLPSAFPELLSTSCLFSAISSYLRNDSILEMAQHISLYRAVLLLLQAMANSGELVSLLAPKSDDDSGDSSIVSLMKTMWKSVDTYVNRINKTKNIDNAISNDSGEQYEGLAALVPSIQEICAIIDSYTASKIEDAYEDFALPSTSGPQAPLKSIEQRYLDVMKKFQFDTYDMIEENPTGGFRFVVSYHFENVLRSAVENNHPARVKRLAQEAVTLSKTLPLSFGSSVFVRPDTDRLDVMKVLITGPDDTPYAGGCFEFDVYFPPDYPNSPPKINLETTGRKSVRFNPNLYNCGKVCLSLLNTWAGNPEEKWNSQTSTTLQVLVSIQSLILVPEPYFNEPGYQSTLGTQQGTLSSENYNANIRQATVKWAMLDQIRNPSPCFKEVIHTHFWIKKHAIITQIEGWIKDLETKVESGKLSSTSTMQTSLTSLRTNFNLLREELKKLPAPPGLEDIAVPGIPVNMLPKLSNFDSLF